MSTERRTCSMELRCFSEVLHRARMEILSVPLKTQSVFNASPKCFCGVPNVLPFASKLLRRSLNMLCAALQSALRDVKCS